jgi:hypothetical protein
MPTDRVNRNGPNAAPRARLRQGAQVIFLDIDNVLHAIDAYVVNGRVVAGSPTSQLFQFATDLEVLLAPYPSVVIILSSSWVPVLGYKFTVAQFPQQSLQARMKGSTFEQEDETDADWQHLSRGAQVLRFVRRYKLRNWLAIDDMRAGFDGHEARLIHCQTGVGLGDKDVQALFVTRLQSTFGHRNPVRPPAPRLRSAWHEV